MKVNDIVVLINGLNSFYLVLEMEKHLFEIVKIDGGVIWLKSLSTGVEVTAGLESIRLATLKERYLVDGNVVELDDGKKYYVSGYYLISVKEIGHYIRIKNFDDNMILKSAIHTFKVNKVYKLKENYMIEDLIWQRTPKIELTDDEKVILKNVDKDYNYIMRTENNLLVSKSMFFSKYPDTMTMSAYNHLFKNITTESGIHEIKELLK